jgi:hypothetical protein
MEAEEVSSEEKLMNQPDSSKEKLIRKRARGSDDCNTFSMVSEHDFVGTTAGRIRSDDDDNDNDNDNNFWM